MIHSISDYTTLHNGVRMPWLGLGVYKTQEGEEVEQAVKAAIEIGYRSIDTAALYHNERGVGNAIKMCGVPREELFITTKVWNSHQGYDATLRAFEESRQKLGLEYLDLYLIHWPVKEKYKDTWRAFEKLYEDGLVRAIGVSNFHVHHLKDLLMDARIIPMVNQVEFHPRLTQKELLRFCKEKGIQMEAWSPLMRGRLLDDPVLNEIGRKYGKTPAQVILRWDLQHGVVTIPKSVHAERIAANADIFDFTLTDEEMNQIDGLNRNERSGQDPDNFQFDF
ncbi:aldo/keto reductase [Aneurinibacillus danicus]|uniref:Glyoxal reductase n=1 Tax=Aneurinibacillus danicus TaxID=267746 RepID=A0A511VBV3_9BACL|nr:aldo/keto reductase [Aneurinibacillus danicus]GEN36324.1 glyoxal reductase [Aneurinibacillus danicus]